MCVFPKKGLLGCHSHEFSCDSGSDEVSEPQPIPHLVCGHDKDWLSLSPYALRYWDKLLLEPYSKQHDIAYVVVSPDNDFIISAVQTFFKEMSTVYELCRLGKHRAISKDLRDGILRIKKTTAGSLANEQVNEWFTFIGEHTFKLLSSAQFDLKPGFVDRICQLCNVVHFFQGTTRCRPN